MNEARRTLGCWLLAAFLGRGCDPTTARLPVAVARVRPLTPGEAAELARRGGNLRVLPRPRRRSAA
ncbi:MAG TPA: hypothetical protein VHQ65_12420, partial [Thermoanaerobaculia bacterium]|nr:hypothetical protein [Thermoanaerobaculia bacterium]